jgi:hypothetical protein
MRRQAHHLFALAGHISSPDPDWHDKTPRRARLILAVTPWKSWILAAEPSRIMSLAPPERPSLPARFNLQPHQPKAPTSPLRCDSFSSLDIHQKACWRSAASASGRPISHARDELRNPLRAVIVPFHGTATHGE